VRGEGQVFISASGAVGGRDAIRPYVFPFGRLRCFVEIRSWFVHLAGAETAVVQSVCVGPRCRDTCGQ